MSAEPRAQSPAPLGPIGSAMFGLLALMVGLTLGGPIRSGDLWWHVRTGQWILDHGRLPETDPFSHTAGETHWILQEYGSQVLMALVHQTGGLLGLRLVGAALGVALLVAFLRQARRVLPPEPAVAVTALFAALFALKWELRPHLISAFFVLRLHALLFDRAATRSPSNRTLLELFALSALWVQLHAEALFAPIMALAGWLGALLTVCIRRPPELAPFRHLARWSGAFVATLAGTLCSPLGVEPHLYALLRRSVPKLYIEEWFPAWILPGDERFLPLDPALFALVATALLATGALGALWGWRRLSGRGDAPRFEALGFLGACGALALDARRFFWLLAFPLREWAAARPWTPGARRWAHLVSAASITVLAGSHYSAAALEDLARGRFGASVDPALFPVGAVEVVRGAQLSGNLYHPYEWGGYLGFELGDANPVFIDGRTVLFEEVIPERWHAERDPDFARQVFADRGVELIVFKRFVVRDGAPRPWRPPGADREWIRAHADDTSEVWLRADSAQGLTRLAQWYAERGVPFDPERGFIELAALASDPAWRQARLLPDEVLERLDPGLALLRAARADRDTAAELEAWRALGAECERLRLGRSTRYAREQAARLAGPR